MSAELVQGRLEVAKDDAIGEAFKDECEFPEGVDVADWDHGGHGQKVHEDADDAKAHTEKQNAESRGHLDNLDEAKLVAELYIPEEVDNSEYPPRVASVVALAIAR